MSNYATQISQAGKDKKKLSGIISEIVKEYNEKHEVLKAVLICALIAKDHEEKYTMEEIEKQAKSLLS